MSLLRDRRFALLALGQAVNAIGSWCALVALWGFASFRFEAGATELALLGLAWAVPPFLIGPFAGVPVDRLGPKRVLIAADAAAAGVAIMFVFADTFTALVALAALDGVTKAFAEPAFQSLPPRIVPDDRLAEANGILATAAQSAIAFGPLLAAVAIGLFGFEGAFVVDAVTYGVGIAVLVPFRIGAAAPAPEARAASEARAAPEARAASEAGPSPGVFAEVREAFRVVAARPDLRRLLALAATVYVTWGAFIVVEPIYVREVLHEGPTTFAALQTTFGIGLFVTGLLVARAGDRMVRWSVVCLGAVGTGIGSMLYVGTSFEVVAFVGLLVWGVVTACFIAPLRTLMQRAAPVELHGRVFALDGTLHNAGDLVSLPLVGLVAGTAGVQVAGCAVAVLPILGGLLVWRRVRAGATAGIAGAAVDAVPA